MPGLGHNPVMPDLAAVWSEALPTIRDNTTGVGVWSALNAGVPVALEEGVFILGLPNDKASLAGHLRLPQNKRTIEETIAAKLESKVVLRVIDGTTSEDWDREKRRDAEKRRLEEEALARARRQVEAGTSWESVYDQLSRNFAALQNRSLPQNRARFFMEAIDIVADALLKTPVTDDASERAFARCLERISQYTDLPSTLVAVKVLERTFAG